MRPMWRKGRLFLGFDGGSPIVWCWHRGGVMLHGVPGGHRYRISDFGVTWYWAVIVPQPLYHSYIKLSDDSVIKITMRHSATDVSLCRPNKTTEDDKFLRMMSNVSKYLATNYQHGREIADLIKTAEPDINEGPELPVLLPAPTAEHCADDTQQCGIQP